jgi:N-acetylmuramoyl-L-alanine amidase
MMQKKTSLAILTVCLLAFLPAQAQLPKATVPESNRYYSVKAVRGDGIYALLRRHGLDGNSCNFTKFYSLNNLKKNAHLIVGNTYELPILTYEFNGRTIRSTIGIDDWNLAVRIQDYNEHMLAQKQREKSFKEDRTLWVPYHELYCPEPDLKIPEPVTARQPEESVDKSGSGNRHFPIFGSRYAYTPLASNKLKGKVFYVVSGHGGPDPGAIGRRGKYNLCEDEYAYDVALRLCRNLVAHGATAYMIIRDNDGIRNDKFLNCDYDEVVWGDLKIMRQQKPRLFQRSNAINELYEKNKAAGVAEQTTIIVHVDSRSKGERKDVFFYYHPTSSESKKIALDLQKALRKKYRKYRANGQYHGTVTPRDLHMLRETLTPSVYIELANIRNKFDQQRDILESNRQALADWLLEGILD